MDYNITIIGAGAVGLAIAKHFSEKGLKCLILEKNHSFGMETSSRNSEVIHAGIYYPEDSLKSILCIRGNALLYQWCDKANVPYKRIGKYIIANSEAELAELQAVYDNAVRKGVPGLSMLSKSEMNAKEPNIICEAAISSETTGIIDSHAFMQSLFDSASAAGADFAFNHSFAGLEKIANGYKVIAESDGECFPIECEYVVNSAGLNSDSVAKSMGIDIESEDLQLHYSKGCYYRISGYPNIASKLIYPVPPANRKSLGIHLTLELSGGSKLGPDAEYISRENINYEVPISSIQKFYEAASVYIRNLKLEHLSPDQSGIRPKLQKPNENFRDFVIREESANGLPNIINLIGIESPGLTSSLAIAEGLDEFIMHNAL